MMAISVTTDRDDTEEIAEERRSQQSLANEICQKIWKHVGCYCLGGQWVWYLQDEVGSSVGHSSEPNVMCVPFIHIITTDDNTFPTMTSYSLLWPIHPIGPGESVERDYCGWVTSPMERICHLVDWLGEEVVDSELVDQIMTNSRHHTSILNEIHQEFVQKMHAVLASPPQPKVPSLLDFVTNLSPGGKLRVWTSPDDPLRLKHPSSGLSHPSFELVEDPSHAHILWYSEPLKETPRAWINSGYSPKKNSSESFNLTEHNSKLPPAAAAGIDSNSSSDPLFVSPDDQFINQFPFEGVFLIKSHLAREIARNIGLPEWWNESYDLETHLMQYVGDYLCRRHSHHQQEQDHDQNVWIIKPSIGTRSQGHVISDSLIHTIRILEVNKKRVAQKYVERPLLWRNGRKWDMRWIVCVRSFNPLELYVYNVFWARVANKSSAPVPSGTAASAATAAVRKLTPPCGC
jgi:tubulin--tyrosine ligase-like protein 12